MSQSHTPISTISKPQPDAGKLPDEVLDSEHAEHLDAETLDAAVAALLALYPQAPVAALQPAGLCVPMPESIQLQRNPILDARSGLDLVVPEDRVSAFATWDRVLAGGAARCCQHLVIDPQSAVWFCGFDLRERHGVILAIYTPAETTAAPARLASRELPKTAPRFATIEKDERSFVIKIDEAITEILGWEPQEMEGHRSIEFIHPDDHGLAIDNWMEMISSPGPGRRVRLRHRHRDQSWVWFEVTNHNFLANPDQRSVVSEMVNISDEMAAHEELRAREQFLDRLAEAVPVGLFQVSAERTVVYTNDRLHEILGVAPASTLRAQLATVVKADRLVLERALDEVLGAGRAADIEVELRVPPHDQSRFCTINLRALSHDDGTISGAIACVADVTDSARMREELKQRATFDELTGCYNRASIMLALDAGVAGGAHRAERAVMFVDLDGFKEVNDRHGHAAGDELLRTVAARLRNALRSGDMVGRFGGDEFLVVCPDAGGPDRAMQLAERLARAVPEHGDGPPRLTHRVSIGVTWSSGDATDADTLVAEADRAMYAAKRAGKGQVKFFTASMREDPLPRPDVISDLHRAIERGELTVHYQPIMSLAEKTIVGAEALVRWNHPRRGLIAPEMFIKLAEECGVIEALGRLVLEQACTHLERWRARMPASADLSVAVNVSAVQLRSPGFLAEVQQTLARVGLPPDRLILEITESVLVDRAHDVPQRLRDLKKLGVRIAVDDFGTGYSGLSYLHEFPVDILKIDKSFVDGIGSSKDSDELVAGVISLAHRIHLQTIAEGIETSAQACALAAMSSELGQGFHFAKPLTATQFEQLLQA